MPITQYNSSVRQMSQSKFDSMKNASGKIPDLANQIVMTNSEDTNISCLRTEVVYDMKSSDASKNWGYTSGIYSDTTVSNKDFSKFSALKVYICAKNNSTVARDSWGRNNILEIDLDNLINIEYGASNLFRYANNNNYFGGAFVAISSDKKSLTFLFYDGETLYTSSSTAFIYKIEGVLKTPSMIYTGDELIAGNGIKIENGVISRIPLYKGSITQAFNTQQTTTSSTQIANALFNKVLNNSSIVVNYSCPLINASGGYGTFIFLKIDGQEQGARCLRNNSGMFCINTIISNLSAGSHTIEFWYGCGGGSASIQAYEQMTATIMEVL